MVLFGDYHTHTIYSHHNHGKSTILENAIMAKQKGLSEIAITDHGFNHKFYAVKRTDIAQMRKEIDEAKKITGINILLGVEANIISSEGDIDINDEDLDKLDILLVGYHKMVKAKNFKEKIKFLFPNNFGIFKNLQSTYQRNTIAILKALERYPISILTHPKVGMPINVVEVGKMAKKRGTFMELNGKRIAYTDKDIEELVKEKVDFIIDSDAHSKERVGECDKPINFSIKNNIPQELIANLGKRPNFIDIHKKG